MYTTYHDSATFRTEHDKHAVNPKETSNFQIHSKPLLQFKIPAADAYNSVAYKFI